MHMRKQIFNQIAQLSYLIAVCFLAACDEDSLPDTTPDGSLPPISHLDAASPQDAQEDAQAPADAEQDAEHDAQKPDSEPDAESDAEPDSQPLDSETDVDSSSYEPPEVNVEISGRYHQIRAFPSQKLNGTREVIIYLPDGYNDYGNQERYPVLYMHDGQNLFRNELATYGTEWEVDETVNSWSRMGRIPKMIVVGIYSTEQRIYDYTPSRDERFHDGGGAEAYAQFLIEELKPYIDYSLRTMPEMEHTGLIGSSLGGLVSLYILARHPGVFGRIGALSNSLFWNNEEALGWADDIAQNLTEGTRLWFDGGSAENAEEGEDPDGDGLNQVLSESRQLLDALLAHGLTYNDRIAYFEDVGGFHNEATWARRLPSVLSFLFGDSETPHSLRLHLYGSLSTGHKTAWGNTAVCPNRTLYWPVQLLSNLHSSNEQVVRIDGGRLDAVSSGTATISVHLDALSASLDVSVQTPVSITFSVGVPNTTPADATIYVSGNLDVLGNWEENAMFPLHLGEDGRWTNLISIPPQDSFEYKITRGSWATVEKGADGQEIDNRTAQALENTTLYCEVARWSDQ